MATVNTVLPMDADGFTTRGAFPADPLLCDELFEPELADIFEILDHAHAVFRAIAFV